MKDLAFIRYSSLEEILENCGLATQKHMVREAFRLGFRSASTKKMNNQEALLAFMKTYEAQNGITPTLQEMKQALGKQSLTSVQRALISLEEQGLVTRDKYQKRSWRIV